MILPIIISMIMNCQKHLIGNDPWPYAQESTSFLIEVYRGNKDPEIRKELEFRDSAGLLTVEQIKELNKSEGEQGDGG